MHGAVRRRLTTHLASPGSMKACAAALFVLVHAAAYGQTGVDAGDAERGKAFWNAPGIECNRCHGNQGEGGWGPTLAGRGLTPDAVTSALRRPALMPAYDATHITDGEAADIAAYMNALPRPERRGAWRVPLPENAPPGQRVAVATLGCAQCHGPVFASPRQALGAVAGDFEWFARMVYDHTSEMKAYAAAVGQALRPRLIMGNYSRATVPEALLREMYDWSRDLGIRANVSGRLSAPVPVADGVRYTLTVENAGMAGIGVAAEALTITVQVPQGSTVIAAAGRGYQGLRSDEALGGNILVWQLPALTAASRETFTLTLSAAATDLRGTVAWVKPSVRTGPVDSVNIFPPPRNQPVAR